MYEFKFSKEEAEALKCRQTGNLECVSDECIFWRYKDVPVIEVNGQRKFVTKHYEEEHPGETFYIGRCIRGNDVNFFFKTIKPT